MEECGRKLGLFRKGTFVFDSEDEMSILMDYCLFFPAADGQNLVERYLANSPPPAGSIEMDVLREMLSSYYSLFQITEVERGVGVEVVDLLRRETGFLVDVGLGNTAEKQFMLASRIISTERFLTTNGAALPVDAPTVRRILADLQQLGLDPTEFDFKRITPSQEAELAASMIRTCRSSGMISAVAYQNPGSQSSDVEARHRPVRAGRNDPCPCGSGMKFKKCCGRNQ